MKKQILSILLVVSILSATVFNTGCQSAINKAISLSQKVESGAVTAIAVTNAAFGEGLLTFEQKEKLLKKLTVFADGVFAFKNAALKLKAEFNSEIPKDRLLILSQMLEPSVTVPFLDLLSELKLISNSSKILTAIALVNFALVSILQALQKETAVNRINQKWKDADLNPLAFAQ